MAIGTLVERLRNDAIDTWRAVARAPRHALAVSLCLGLGAAGTLVTYSTAYAALWRPLPFPHAERLVALAGVVAPRGQDVIDWLASSSHTLSDSAICITGTMSLRHEPQALPLTVSEVSATFFDLTGITPAIGRRLTVDDERGSDRRLVVISHRLWMQAFGGAADVLSRSLVLNRDPFTIVGVMPRGFDFPGDVDAWLLRAQRSGISSPRIGSDERAAGSGAFQGRLFARLNDTATLLAARTELTALMQTRSPSPTAKLYVGIAPLHESLTARTRPTLLLLAIATICVFLVACANASNLIVLQGNTRARDVAVRLALGAGRATFVRQTLVQAVALTGLAALMAFASAGLLQPLARAAGPRYLPAFASAGLSPSAFLVVMVVIFACTWMSLLVPTLRYARADLRVSLSQSGQGMTSSRRQARIRAALVMAQVAITVPLAFASIQMARAFAAALSIAPGIEAGDRVIFRTYRPRDAAAPQADTAVAAIPFADRLLEQLAAIPGVSAVASADGLPLDGTVPGKQWLATEDERLFDTDGERPSWVYVSEIAGDYFGTLGIPVVAGAFSPRAHDAAAAVDVSTARLLWPDGRWIGRRIKLGDRGWHDVTAVVADVAQPDASSPRLPQAYVADRGASRSTFVIHAAIAPTNLARLVSTATTRLDPDVTVSGFQPLDAVIERGRATPRTRAYAVALFATVALGLTALGVYTVVLFSVRQRMPELGIRAALGASPARLRRGLVRDTLMQLAVAAAAGVGVSLLSSAFLGRILLGGSSTSPLMYLAAAVVALIVGTVSTLLATSSVLRLDPKTALYVA